MAWNLSFRVPAIYYSCLGSLPNLPLDWYLVRPSLTKAWKPKILSTTQCPRGENATGPGLPLALSASTSIYSPGLMEGRWGRASLYKMAYIFKTQSLSPKFQVSLPEFQRRYFSVPAQSPAVPDYWQDSSPLHAGQVSE